MNDLIVVINAGSTTVKFAGYEVCDNSTGYEDSIGESRNLTPQVPDLM